MSHHDLAFKGILGQPEHAGPYLRAQLPPALARRVDWDTLALEPGSYVDEALGERHSDLLYSARLTGPPIDETPGEETPGEPEPAAAQILFYVLIEHQKTVDPLMPFRSLVYMVRIWERWLADRSRERHLPPIYPLVVHQGPRPWTAPVGFAELVLGRLDPAVAEPLRPHVPDFALALHDLPRSSDAELEGTAIWQVTLALFKHIHHPDLLDWLDDWLCRLSRVTDQPGRLRALRMLVCYLIEARDDATPALLLSRPGAASREVEDLVMSVADKLREEGREQGREEGREQGREEGLNAGRRALLMRQLALKFGDAARHERDRLERATPEQLERWAERILVAETLDGVFE